MKIEFEGRTWQYDEDEITLEQAMAMRLVHGLTILDWQEGLARLDERALQCSYWLMLNQNGIVKPVLECEFSPVAFTVAYRDAQAAERAAEKAKAEAEKAAADPTPPPSLTGSAESPESATQTDTTPPPPVPPSGTGWSPAT